MEPRESTHTSGTQRALALGPLLTSIGRELQERSDALALLLVRRRPRAGRDDPPGPLEAECAMQRRELRRVHRELERLGCSLVSLHPRVFIVETGKRTGECVLYSCPE